MMVAVAMNETSRTQGQRAVLFAGGGTGGHIFPGIAIAERLESLRPGAVSCVFAVSQRPLDSQILRDAGRRFVAIPAQPVSLRPRGFLKFVSSWGKAVRAGRQLIRELRTSAPGGVEVLAMGGFVAAPVVQAARVEGVPVSLVNLDAIPGRANRWIAGRCDRVFSAVPVQEGSLRSRSGVRVVPPIVRAGARAPGDPSECRSLLGLDPARPTLMVTGASQGAKSINSFLLALVEKHADVLRRGGWQIIHQTGKGEAQRVKAGYDAAGIPSLVQEFFDGMGRAWGAAEVAVSRSGAGSVAEAWGACVPTLFLPYPYHKDQHQKYNALAITASGASVLGEDRIDAAQNLATVGPVLLELLTSPARRAEMRSAYASLGPANGQDQIAEAVVGAWNGP